MSFKSTTTVEQQPDGTVTITATTVVTPGASSGEKEEPGLDLLPPADPWADYFATLTPSRPPAEVETEVGEGVINIFDPVRRTRDGYIRSRSVTASSFDEHWVIVDPAHLYCPTYYLVEFSTVQPNLGATVQDAINQFGDVAKVAQFQIARCRVNYADAPTNATTIPTDVVPPGTDIRIYELGSIPTSQLAGAPEMGKGRMYQATYPNGTTHEVWYFNASYQTPNSSNAVVVKRLPGPGSTVAVNPGPPATGINPAVPMPNTKTIKAFLEECIALDTDGGSTLADTVYTRTRLGTSD